jgi:phage terminase small subunit
VENKLTIKQENFCLEYVKSGNASEAYKKAYSAGNLKASTINREAKSLLDNHKITTRIKELREPVIEKAQITLEGHLADLLTLRELAVKYQQISAAINAEIARGKAAGIHIEKSQVNLNTLNPMVIVRYGDKD